MTRAVLGREVWISRDGKRIIVAEIERRMAALYNGNQQAVCLYWAGHTHDVLREAGLNPILQAGTAMWRFAAQDDGTSATHFGYTWEPDHPVSRAAVAAGMLPEMHVWVGLPDTQEIVDMTTRFLPAQAAQMGGYLWTAPPPPPWLWASAKDCPADAAYEPNREATFLALRCLAEAARG